MPRRAKKIDFSAPRPAPYVPPRAGILSRYLSANKTIFRAFLKEVTHTSYQKLAFKFSLPTILFALYELEPQSFFIDIPWSGTRLSPSVNATSSSGPAGNLVHPALHLRTFPVPQTSSRPIISVPALAQATSFPARGFPTSTSVHIVIIASLLLLRLAPITRDDPRHRQFEQRVQLDDSREPILPEVQSSSASGSSPSSASSRSAQGHNAPSSASSMLLIHQRRQHIISNTPDATNPVQTILQPDLENPPRLAATLPIPSMVRMASVQRPPTLTAPTFSAVVKPATPPTPAPTPQPTLPKAQPTTLDTVPLTSATELANAPKLAVYAASGRSYDPPKPPPPSPSVTKPSAPALAANNTPSTPSPAKPSSGTDTRNLLVVNAIEVQSTLSEHDIPAAEIHGRFEVTVTPSLPEGPTTGGSSSTAGVTNSGLATSGSGSGKGATPGSGAGSEGTRGKGAGSGTSNIASTGHGNGHGIGTGEGEGSGHGSGGISNGAGAGAGGNGSSPFSGMTIVGGSSSGNAALHSAPDTNASIDVKNPQGYGMTIMSNGASGGGVRDLGVFNDGPVYTVYVDVSRLGLRSRWSLQYSASREVRIAHPGVALTPPFAQDEQLPQLPPAAVAANIGRIVVVQGNLKVDGKLEAMRVLESPDQRLNEGVIEGLRHWCFEPAAMGTEKVAVKVLMGIPITSIMADNGVSQQADQRLPVSAVPRAAAQ